MFYRTQGKRDFWLQCGGYEYVAVNLRDHKIPKNGQQRQKKKRRFFYYYKLIDGQMLVFLESINGLKDLTQYRFF